MHLLMFSGVISENSKNDAGQAKFDRVAAKISVLKNLRNPFEKYKHLLMFSGAISKNSKKQRRQSKMS